MACERRLDGDLRRLQIPDLADHDDVRVLAQDRAQRVGKIEPDRRLHLDLVDAGKLIFNGVLHREELAVRAVEAL